MLRKLLLLSFVEGGAVMAAELCGAKLLAPVFGSSLYVWASVMGITLGALALGYFFGGYYSTALGGREKKLFLILNLAALFVMAMPLIGYYLVPRISYLPFLTGVVVSSACLLFFPVFLLGASSPFFIALQANNDNPVGKVSGTVYAVSTAGGIAATFLCGFWLIPQLGLNTCLLIFGGLLFGLNIVVFKLFKTLFLFLFAGLVYLTAQFYLTKPNTLRSSDGLLGRLEVSDVVQKNKDTVRFLTINGTIQTEMNLARNKGLGDYISLFDTLVPPGNSVQNALLLGMGGGLTANVLAKKSYRVDAVDIDGRIIEAARDFFFLDKRVNAVQQDARYYMNNCSKTYQLVLFDVFKAEEQPGHVITSESLERLKGKLSASARVMINWHGFISGEEGKGTSVLFNTLVASGFHVKLCSLSDKEDARNIVFVASLNPLPALPFEINNPLIAGNLVNTDNRPLMEKYNALANKKWRAQYLRYYQQGS